MLRLVRKKCLWFLMTLTPTLTPEEMEHFQVLELELSDWGPFCTFPPHLESQTAGHLSLRSWPKHLGPDYSMWKPLDAF